LYAIERFIPLGMVPVTSGDMVSDSAMGFSVMSGDIALWKMVIRWKPEIIAYGTNVAGIHTDDPTVNPDAKLLEKIDSSIINNILQNITEGESIDVSGAMKGKFKVVMAILKEYPEAKVHIFNLNYPELLLKIVNGEEFSHSVISK
ncbi:MAG: amino acid kinase family protein, partial [Candidatus Hodarchaeales archaeon]